MDHLDRCRSIFTIVMTSKVFQFNLDKLICTDAYYDFVKRTIGLKLESRIGVKGMNMKGIVDINNSPV